MMNKCVLRTIFHRFRVKHGMTTNNEIPIKKEGNLFPSFLLYNFYFKVFYFTLNFISVLLFIDLPSAVLLLAIGLENPKPCIVTLLLSTPLSIR